MGCSSSVPADSGEPNKKPTQKPPQSKDNGSTEQRNKPKENEKRMEMVREESQNRRPDSTTDTTTDSTNTANITTNNPPKQEAASISQVIPTFIKNDLTGNVTLPELDAGQVKGAFAYGSGRGKWPIRNYSALNISVDGFHGGCAGLVQCSNSYGGQDAETTAETFLHRSGFSGHHFTETSIISGNTGHFGCQNYFVTDESGNLIGDLMFGDNNMSLMSSDPKHGDMSHGLVIPAISGDDTTILPIDVKGSSGSGNTLVICTGWESGSGDAQFKIGCYMVRIGKGDNFQEAKLFHGEDKWKFEVINSQIAVSGLPKSQYGIYHNSTKNIVTDQVKEEEHKAFAGHTKSFKGDEEMSLLKVSGRNSGAFLVMCSNTSSTLEDASCAALYCLTYDSSGDLTTKHITGQAGDQYRTKESDLWKFAMSSETIKVTGPKGPCKYGVISNIGDKSCEINSDNRNLCLASGQPQAFLGIVDITKERVLGKVNLKCDIRISVNNNYDLVIPGEDLKEVGESEWAFAHDWTKVESKPGLKLVRVTGTGKSVIDGSPVDLEMTGSPSHVIHNFPGVVYAVNCGGPDYESQDGIVYEAEFSKFANFSYDFNCGSRCTAGGMIKNVATFAQQIASTSDGTMFACHRTPYAEAVDEKHTNHVVEGLPNGKYTLRINMVYDDVNDLMVNGERVGRKLQDQIKKVHAIISGRTAHCLELPVTISNGTLTMAGRSYCVCSFAVLSKDFIPRQKSKDQLNQEKVISQKLIDRISPLARTMGKKERKLVGWSQNLLKNASAENNNLDWWNVRGDIKVQEGGYGTEKMFVTSHMWCSKSQDVNLLDHFSAEYLDTAPSIEVLEWYREGVCGGGHYYFRAALLDGNGQIIKEHILPETGRIYKNNAWTCEEANFTNYGPGARTVVLQSRGKDDKHWGGHYGILMSAAEVRVQRETFPAANDLFEDIISTADITAEKETLMVRDREELIGKILKDNAALLQDLVDERVVSGGGDPGRVLKLGHMKRPKLRKKREVRVFVSSTFRDFTQEREELIKKSFREINKICVDRGVSFTYVDLRWGINEEQTQHGETIAICLREIDRCRPYFICMMGERYGWSQRTGTSDALLDGSFNYAAENFPKQLGWVDKFRWDTSVTKLEILHGVLNDIENRKERSFFYLRDPVQDGDVSAQLLPKMKAESEWHLEKQNELRNLITKEKELRVRKYKHHLDACEKIKSDLEMCINEDFPLGTELSALERERESHIAFAEARRRVYIGREDYFTTIDSFMDTRSNQPLVILGESGSGKSALVANWVGRTDEKLPNAFIFVHFIGSSAESSSYIKLLRRLYEEMKEFYGFELPVPQSDQNLVQDLPSWLKLAGSVKEVPCLIVMDALNQLQAESGGAEGPEHDLMWIPRVIPTGVKMLLSTLPGRAYEAVERQGWPTMKVEPLKENEKMQIVTEYLEDIYGKHLAENQKSLIVDAAQTNNPLYLKALLDEVRMFGSFRALTAKIEDFLSASNPPELFAKILSRLEEDFETSEQSKGLVRKTASAIWCSNKGMTEAELLAMLDIPSPVWSPFYLSVVDNLVNRNGVVNFFHDHLRQAVEAKYLPTDSEKKTGFSTLADFFSTMDISDRVAEELPFVLAKAGDMQRLKEVISKVKMFEKLIKTEEGKFDLIKYWTMLGDFNQVEAAYNKDLEENTDLTIEEMERVEQGLAQFYVDLGLFAEARTMFERLLEQSNTKYKQVEHTMWYDPHTHKYKIVCNHKDVINLLNKLGLVCEKQKDFAKAKEYYEDAIRHQNRVDAPETKLQLTESLLGEASVCTGQDNAKEAILWLLRGRQLAEDVLGPRHHYVAAIMNKIGQLVYMQGRVDEALAYYLQDLRLTRSDVGTSHPRVAGILNDIALAYDERNDPLAGKIYEAALYILLSLYGESHLDVACLRYNLGSFYFATNSFARGKFQFTGSLKVYEQFLGNEHSDTVEARKALEEISAFVKD